MKLNAKMMLLAASLTMLATGGEAVLADGSAEQKKAPWVPFNTASTYYNPLQFVLRPTEITLVCNIADNLTAVGTNSSMAANLDNVIPIKTLRGGIGIQTSRSVDSKGVKSDILMPVAGIDVRGFRAGVKLPFSGVGTLTLGQSAVQAGYSSADFKAVADIAPKKGKSAANATLTADVISGDIGVSGLLKFDGKKSPMYALGAEYRFAEGLALGAAIHPEKAFLSGKANPSMTLRYASKTTTANFTIQPQSKMMMKFGVGMRF